MEEKGVIHWNPDVRGSCVKKEMDAEQMELEND